MAQAEQQEGHGEGEEQREEGDGGAERAEKQDEGEDEPAHEIETHGVEEVRLVAALSKALLDAKAARGEDDGEGDPETTVRGESSSTESVTDSHFPGYR